MGFVQLNIVNAFNKLWLPWVYYKYVLNKRHDIGEPANSKNYPEVKVVAVYTAPDAKILFSLAQAIINGKLLMPTTVKFPLKEAKKAHEAFEKGGWKNTIGCRFKIVREME